MSENEQTKLNYLIQKFEQHSAHVNQELDTIKRGLYGDKPNKVPGLLDRQDQDEIRIKSLENTRKKALWMGAGFVAAIELAALAVREFFTSK